MSAPERKIILLVEDEAIIALAQAKTLERFGYDTIVAGSGENAVKLAIGSGEICLVLMDIDLGPGIDGTETARRILAERQVPIVFLTSHAEREMVEKVRGITRYGYVIKNSGDFVLQSSIEMALDLFDAHEKTKGQEAEQARLNRALRMLSDSNQALIRGSDEAALLDEVCGIAVKVGGYRMAWVGFAEGDEGRTPRLVAHAGLDEGYLEVAKLAWEDDEGGQGPADVAMTSGEPSLIRDIAGDRAFAPWRDAALRLGYRSIIVLPLKRDAVTIGAIGIFSAEVDVFDAAEITILKELAGDLSYGIVALRTRAAHDQAVADLRLFRQLLDQSNDAIFMADPETGRILDSNDTACRSLGYSRDELLLLRVPDFDPNMAELGSWVKMVGTIQSVGALTVKSRLSRKDGSVFPVEVGASFVREGAAEYLIAVVRDITDREQAEEELASNIRYFESMDRVNQAMQGASDLEGLMGAVLETTQSLFGSDRAWLLYPCDPGAPTFRVPMEVTRPEYPGAKVLNLDVPMTPEEAQSMREALETSDPVMYAEGTDRPIATAKQFGVKSQMFTPVYPKTGKPWVFGMHQCSFPRLWTRDERKLFREIGRRLAPTLTSLLISQDLLESDAYYRSLFEDSANAIAEEDFSAVHRRISELRKSGISDLATWFGEHPEELIRCIGLVRLVRTNREFKKLVGTANEGDISPTLEPYFNWTSETLDGIRDEILALSEGKLPFDREFPNDHLSSDIKWVKLRMTVVPGHENDWSRVMVSFMDITEQKKTEKGLQRAAEENEFLMRELEHRVKNNLHIISSLLNLGSQRLPDQEAKRILVDAEMRIHSIALIYDFLSHSSRVDRLDSANYVENLIRLLQDTYAVARGDIRINAAIENFELDVKKCVPLGLIINELLSNVFKHAFPLGRRGEIVVELKKAEGAMLLSVRDDGVGLPRDFDWRTGESLGIKSVNMLTSQLEGTMSLSEAGGVTVSISIPLSDRQT